LDDFSGADFASSLGEALGEADCVAVDDIAEDDALAAGVGKR
jgi:hypothetical protein